MNSAYTYCANCEYDDFGGEIHRQQLNRVLTERVEIKGSVWTDNTYGDSGWHRTPHNNIRWDFEEWGKWNEYVKSTNLTPFTQEWLKDM